MSTTAEHSALGGFEERLLVQLKAHVASQPATVAQPSRTSQGRYLRHLSRGTRVSLPAAAAIVALITGLLSLLPGTAPTLAQAFPILNERPHVLPARYARVLRAQWLTAAGPHFDLRHAHAFDTPAGTGYAIVDRRAKWLCILIPGFSPDTAGGRCERVTLARAGQPPLTLRISGGDHRQEVVALLTHGATASATTAAARGVSLKMHRGVVAILTHGPVTLTTIVGGHRSATVTYTP